MNIEAQKSGRPARTRERLIETFNRLLLEGERERPRVAKIVSEAGVARSTFYSHFDGVEALLDESLGSLFCQIARCLIGKESEETFEFLLSHIHENRRRGRDLLTGQRGERAEALLARQLLEEMPEHREARLHAILIAGTVMAALSSWVAGKLSTSPEQLASRLLTTAKAVLESGD